METAADVGGTRPPAQARPGGPEPREAADARGDQIVHGAPGDPAHRRPVRRLLCCAPGLWPQGCRGCGSSRGGRGRRTCQDEARGAGSEEGRGAVWAGGARGAAAGTVTAGGRRQHRGPGRRWSASPGAGGRRSPLPAERARPCGREHAEALVGRDAGGRGSLSTLPSCPRSSELHGPGRRQLRGPLPGNPHPGSTHRLADPGWALCLEVPVEPQTPSCPSQGSEPSHRSSHSASASAPGQSFFPGRISSPPERAPPLQAPDCAVWDGVCGHSQHCVPGRAGARSHRLSQ